MAVEAVSNQEEADNSAVGRERYTGGVDGMEVEERKYKHRGGGYPVGNGSHKDTDA